MYTDDQGAAVPDASILGTVLRLPVAVRTFRLADDVESALQAMLKDTTDGHGAANLVLRRTDSGEIVVDVLVGHRFGSHVRVGGYAQLGQRSWEAGVATKIVWAP